MVIYIEEYLARRRDVAAVPVLRRVAGAGRYAETVPAHAFAARWRSELSVLTVDLPLATDLRTLYAEATLI